MSAAMPRWSRHTHPPSTKPDEFDGRDTELPTAVIDWGRDGEGGGEEGGSATTCSTTTTVFGATVRVTLPDDTKWVSRVYSSPPLPITHTFPLPASSLEPDSRLSRGGSMNRGCGLGRISLLFIRAGLSVRVSLGSIHILQIC